MPGTSVRPVSSGVGRITWAGALAASALPLAALIHELRGSMEFSEVRIAPVQLLGVFPEEIGRLAVALRALDAVP
jgi:hypothetical protein